MGIGDALDGVDFIEPELARVDEVGVCEVGYLERVVVVAEEGELSLLYGNVAFV